MHSKSSTGRPVREAGKRFAVTIFCDCEENFWTTDALAIRSFMQHMSNSGESTSCEVGGSRVAQSAGFEVKLRTSVSGMAVKRSRKSLHSMSR